MISVLCVNYHSAADVTRLAATLRLRDSNSPVELIVTNNSAEDDIHEKSDDRLNVCIIDSPNIGFAAGINLALHHSVGDIIMVANPDVLVRPNTLQLAIDFLAAHRDVGIVLPKFLNPDDTVQSSVRRFYTWPVVLYARTPLRAMGLRPTFFRNYLCEEMPLDRPSDVDWGIGAAMFLRREDFPDNKIFDERFFLYFEDVDLCLRMWQRGRRVVYNPLIQCTHAHKRASSNPLTSAGWRHLRSLVQFIRKHRGLPQRPLH